MLKIEASRAFGVGVSSVKRYVATANAGRSLAPKKRPDSKPKLDEAARKLLEADLQERSAATLPGRRQFLRRACGVSVSDSTVSRMLRHMGWSRETIGGCERDEFLRIVWRTVIRQNTFHEKASIVKANVVAIAAGSVRLVRWASARSPCFHSHSSGSHQPSLWLGA